METIALIVALTAFALALYAASIQVPHDKAARDAIEKLGEEIGYDDISFYNNLGVSLVHKTVGQMHKEAHQKDRFQLLLDHLGLKLEEGERIVKRKP